MYRVTETYAAPWQTGPEYQLLDDAGVGYAPNDSRSCGGLYALAEPKGKVPHPLDQFQTARIRVSGGRVRHWLNGVLVVDCSMRGSSWAERIAASKFKKWERFGREPEGHIGLQDHGHDVWFRNIRIRRIQAGLNSGAIAGATSAMREHLERFQTDRSLLQRRHAVPMSASRRDRFRDFYLSWRDELEGVNFDALDQESRVEYVLFRSLLDGALADLEEEGRRDAEVMTLLPFAHRIVTLGEARSLLLAAEGESSARILATLIDEVSSATKALSSRAAQVSPSLLLRSEQRLRELRRSLRGWFAFHDGYNPDFSWWCRAPHDELGGKLDTFAAALRRERNRGGEDGTLIGDPIGRDALELALAREFIPYSPSELIEIAESEMAWCDARMAEASRALGFGDDWRAAQNAVKNLYVPPGEQPKLIEDLAWEAVDFLDAHELVTVPELCRKGWRMEMMSPERQKVSPYFLGGEAIIVSYPTDGMAHADKMMSLRGNNPHFSRATVQHELIPGHHLQGYMNQRHRPWRRLFRTPFWIEGWALYWEMLLWDLDFPQSPENEVGMLFWRKHRCARIIFSLRFHLAEMSAREAVNFLIERVGHEPNNAEAEVRRSVGGAYGPLYQAAYMLGGLQIRAMHRELVQSGKVSNRVFHDAILERNSIPVELLRASMLNLPLTRDYRSNWRFYDE